MHLFSTGAVQRALSGGTGLRGVPGVGHPEGRASLVGRWRDTFCLLHSPAPLGDPAASHTLGMSLAPSVNTSGERLRGAP